MDDIDTLYRMFFNLAIQSVTQKALENGYTVEEIMNLLCIRFLLFYLFFYLGY